MRGLDVAPAARCCVSVVGLRARSPADHIVPLLVIVLAAIVALPVELVDPVITAPLPVFSRVALFRASFVAAWMAFVLEVSVVPIVTASPAMVPSFASALPAGEFAPVS